MQFWQVAGGAGFRREALLPNPHIPTKPLKNGIDVSDLLARSSAELAESCGREVGGEGDGVDPNTVPTATGRGRR